MKYELPCAVVRDLLPSYAEGLTEEETSSAVKAHLDACADCRSRYEAMIEGEAPSVEETKEVDYLKTVRKKNRKKIILSVLLAVVLVLCGVGGKLFLIGTPCGPDALAVMPTLVHGTNELRVELFPLGSAMTVLGHHVETQDGVTRVTVRQGLVSTFNQVDHGMLSMELPLDGIDRVEVCGKIVWQNGLVIDHHSNRLYDAKTPYAGNASAVDHLISNLDLDAPSTIELQTSQPPYGLTIHFSETLEKERHFMPERSAFLLLALVDNLEVVTWDDPSGYQDALTAEEANHALADHQDAVPFQNIKEYGQDTYSIQALRNFLHI